MGNEAIEVEGPYVSRDFTVADGATIEKNTLCSLADPRTAAANTGKQAFAGIATTEKVASNGKTELGLKQTGVHDLTAMSGPAITAGALVRMSGPNMITGGVVEADIVAGMVVGKALESTAAGTWEVIEVDIGVRG